MGVGHFIYKFSKFCRVFTSKFKVRLCAGNRRLCEVCVLFLFFKEKEKIEEEMKKKRKTEIE